MFQRILKREILPIVFGQKGTLVRILLSLLALSLSSSLLLLLAGPLITSMLQGGQTLALDQLLPKGLLVLLPNLKGIDLPLTHLRVYIPLLILAAALLKGISGFAYQKNQGFLALRVATSYRTRLVAALLAQPYQTLRQRGSGEWMSLLMNDVEILSERFSQLTTQLLKDSMILLAALATMMLVHWPLTLTILLLGPVAAWFLGWVGKSIALHAQAWQKELALMNGRLLGLRARFDFIRAQGGEEFEFERFHAHNQSYYRRVRQSLFVRSAFAPWLEWGGMVGFVVLIFGISQGFWFSDLTPSVLIQLLAGMGMLVRPLRQLGEQYSRFQEAKGVLGQSMELLAKPSDVPKALPSGTEFSEMRIRSLKFGYQTPLLTLEDLSFEVGRAYAVLGPSGCGKSTFLQGFAGLLSNVQVDSEPPFALLQRESNYVAQKPFLFDGTLRDNLGYGLPQGLLEGAQEVLEGLGLEELVFAHPNGLDQKVRGIQPQFSGGQCQRLMVARGLLRGLSHKLWLFDEVTSALNPALEAQTTHYILKRAREAGALLLFVTHRLDHLSAFDEVLFFENGQLVLKEKASVAQNHPRIVSFKKDEGYGITERG